jgi:CheY-like chemotaxis protein
VNLPRKLGLKILIVDDDPAVGCLIKLLLLHDGHAAQAVANPEAALSLVQHHRFDLFITDFRMPGMTGDELAARIKTLQPGLPVILTTGFVEKPALLAEKARIVNALLLKPFSLLQLREVIALVAPVTLSRSAGARSVVNNQRSVQNRPSLSAGQGIQEE